MDDIGVVVRAKVPFEGVVEDVTGEDVDVVEALVHEVDDVRIVIVVVDDVDVVIDVRVVFNAGVIGGVAFGPHPISATNATLTP
jgi:hypothetical protein